VPPVARLPQVVDPGLKVGDDHFEITAIGAFAGRDSVRVLERALAWMVDRSPEALEPTVSRVKKTAAFNMSVDTRHAAAT
jgi:hypothetical protein